MKLYRRFAARTRCKLAPDSEGKPFGHCGVLKGGGPWCFLFIRFSLALLLVPQGTPKRTQRQYCESHQEKIRS